MIKYDLTCLKMKKIPKKIINRLSSNKLSPEQKKVADRMFKEFLKGLNSQGKNADGED